MSGIAKRTVRRGGVGDIEVLIDDLSGGAAACVVLLPSLGRGAEDFDQIARLMAAAGFRVLRPQPRGIGASTGATYADLQDCAADIAAVIEAETAGPALVAGHAFGNRVARMLATDRPELVRAVALIAANVGHAPSPPDVRAAIRASADPTLPRETRLDALRFAFFAPGNDPEAWLEGWHPGVLAAQRAAGDRTSRMLDYAGGGKPILYLQPSHDPLAHVEDAENFQRENGDRVSVVVVPNASHAAIAEQPAFIARALIDYGRAMFAATGNGAARREGWAVAHAASLRYVVSGRGTRSLILLHGLGSTSDSWDDVACDLDADFRILRFDQRGAGLSEKVRQPYTLDDLVADMSTVIADAGLSPPFHVASQSAGACLAVAFAARHPSTTKAIALCAPSLGATPERAAALIARGDVAVRCGMRAIVDAALDRSYPPSMRRHRDAFEVYRARMLAADPVCYAMANRVLAQADLSDTLNALDVPALLLAGRHDVMRPPAEIRALAAGMRRATIEEIDAGHIMIVQAPQTVAAVLRRYFVQA